VATNLEQALRHSKDALRPSPIWKQLGMRLISMEPGHATMELRVRKQVTNTQGAVHGGAIATLADTAMGAACWSTMEAGRPFATLDLRVSFLRSVISGRLLAEGVLVRTGKTARFAECTILDGDGILVARASCTFLALERMPSEKRRKA
jgi:uncharacterized protein (TIGR00369 family)